MTRAGHWGEKSVTGARESRCYQWHIKCWRSHDPALASIWHFPPPQPSSLLGSALSLLTNCLFQAQYMCNQPISCSWTQEAGNLHRWASIQLESWIYVSKFTKTLPQKIPRCSFCFPSSSLLSFFLHFFPSSLSIFSFSPKAHGGHGPRSRDLRHVAGAGTRVRKQPGAP